MRRPAPIPAPTGTSLSKDPTVARSKGRVRLLVLGLALSLPVAAREATPLAADPALEARVMQVAEELRCLVCQNETLAASQADLAVDLRAQIRERLQRGESPAGITDFMVARYGEFVRYRPAFSATTALLWTGPFVLLAVAAGGLATTLRRRRQAPPAALTDGEAQRVRALRLDAGGAAVNVGLFWAVALALVAATWLSLRAGVRRAATTGPLPGRANVRMLDEELAALHADLARGAIDPVRHDRARVEIERRLLDEAPDAAAGHAAAGAPRTLAALALVLPLLSASGYLLLGNPAALSMPAAATAAEPDVSAADVQAMVDALAQRLRGQPAGRLEDLQGWVMLARSYAALQRFDDAASAYERAVTLAPDDAQLLADLADVLAMRHAANGPPRADDRSTRLIERALQIDPNNLKALALAGSAAFERNDTAAAIGFWTRARALAPAGSDFAAGLDRSLAEAGAVAPAAAPVVAADASVSGQVHLAPALASRVAPGDTVFIYARAVNGPPMPLAILRRTAGELPIAFTLDDSLAMSPDWRLSQVPAFVVGARVSRSGDARPQAGDLVGQVEAVAGGGALSVTIDRIQP